MTDAENSQGEVGRREVPCVGAVVFDDDGRLLLIRRGNPPAQGQWSLPGGRVEPGEETAAAVLRELIEETGLSGTVDRHVGEVRRDAPDGSVYVISDYLVRVTPSDSPVAGDDALDVAWFSLGELEAADTSPGLLEALRDWRLIPG
jgi:ADP-ribose pyrophosphatase YjhB (NUDIX family)